MRPPNFNKINGEPREIPKGTSVGLGFNPPAMRPPHITTTFGPDPKVVALESPYCSSLSQETALLIYKTMIRPHSV